MQSWWIAAGLDCCTSQSTLPRSGICLSRRLDALWRTYYNLEFEMDSFQSRHSPILLEGTKLADSSCHIAVLAPSRFWLLWNRSVQPAVPSQNMGPRLAQD